MEAQFSLWTLSQVVLASSVVSSAVTIGINAFRDMRANERKGAHTALEVVRAVEAYAHKCFEIMSVANYEVAMAGNHRLEGLTVEFEPFTFPDGFDWSGITAAERSQLSGMVDLSARSQRLLSSVHNEYWDASDYAYDLQEQLAKLVVASNAISEEARTKWKLGKPNVRLDAPVQRSLTVLEQVAARRKQQEEEHVRLFASAPPVPSSAVRR